MGKSWSTHRLAYFLTHGAIPEGKTDIKHTCDNSACCNPAHLYTLGDEVYQKLVIERFWRNVDKNGTTPLNKPCVGNCWIWQGTTDDKGYGNIAIAGAHVKAHRFSYELANKAIPASLYVCHKCDNPLCVRPEHLFVGTQKDNMQDAISKGRMAHGESLKGACLTEQAVRDIRANKNVTIAELARKYNVNWCTVYYVRQGKTWKHVK